MKRILSVLLITLTLTACMNSVHYQYADASTTTWTAFKINPGAVPNTKSKGETYEPEYKRLQAWLAARMNLNNPGLGDLWLEFFPSVKMKDSDESDWSNWDAAKELINTFPPGTFNYSQLTAEDRKMIKDALNDSTPAAAPNQGTDVLTQIVNGYKVVKDTAGNIKAVYNAYGELVNPGSPEYTKVTQSTQAGMGNMLGIGLGVAALIALAVAGSGSSKK